MPFIDPIAAKKILWRAKDPLKNSFITYKNYLLGLNYLAENLYPTHTDLLGALKKNTYRTSGATEPIKKLLFNCWNTEVLLHIPTTFAKELTKYSNHWSPVQSYYSVYLGIRALFIAKDKTGEETHKKTLATVISFIVDEKLFPAPWNLVFGTDGYLNLPVIENEDVKVLENPVLFKSNTDKLWNFPRIFVRRTRERAIEKACEKWKKENVNSKGQPYKALPKGRLELLNKGVRQYSLFDCLYRLRLRSNYEDADIFMSGVSDDEAEQYIGALCGITDKSLLIIEAHITSMIGTEKMQSFITDYEKRHKKTIELLGTQIGIFKRKEYLLST
jgi:hypothetical protein